MSITFELTIADLRAFQCHSRERRPEFLRALWVTHGILAVLTVYVTSITVAAYGVVIKVVTCLLVYAGLWALMRLIGWLIYDAGKSVRSYEKGMSGILGKQTITLDAEGLKTVTPVSEGLRVWRGVYLVETTEDYIFIYVASNSAHVIPRRAFASGDEADLFFHAAWEYHQAASGKVG